MDPKDTVKISKFREVITPFVIGTVASCSATSIIQPIDTLKVRLQIASEQRGMSGGVRESMPSVASRVFREEGIRALYKGLPAALFRQATYGTIRIGVYRTLADREMKINKSISLAKRLAYSLIGGGVGSFFGNPFDVALVRFQSDHTLPIEQRRNYKSLPNALVRMYTEEGLLIFWKGYLINFMRACAMTSAMFTVNDEVKHLINVARKIEKPDQKSNLAAAAISGVACSFCSLPFDNIKTKIQKMKVLPDGSLPYSGILDCFGKTFKREGIQGFWSGYGTYYFRVAPHAMVVLIMENLLHKKFNPNFKH